MKQNMIVVILLVAVAAGGGFFAGTKYQQNKRTDAFTQMRDGQPGTMTFRNGSGTTTGARNGFRPVAGEIIKSDDASITVKLADGSNKIVLIPSSAAINKAEAGTKADLITGTQVAVFGSENTDGSVTAQNVQLNPTRTGIQDTPDPTQ